MLLVLTAPAAFAQDVAVKCRFGVGVTDGENGIESQAAKPDITFILHIRSDSGVVTAEGSRCARLNGTVVGTRVQLRCADHASPDATEEFSIDRVNGASVDHWVSNKMPYVARGLCEPAKPVF